ncbi:MAG: hypothetical protein ACJA1Z_003545 [Patiriisocius sp.]|jgi:hypothetical protein
MRILKIVVYIVLGFFIFTILAAFGGYLYYANKFPVDEIYYPNYIAYIDQENATLNDVYTLCDAEAIYYVHHSAAEEGYAGNKKQFRNNILASYKNEKYKDSGYLNFRFLVSCEGNPGWFKIIQVDEAYNPTQFSKRLVDQLLALTAKPEHWNTINVRENPVDYYMYVSYKLKDGEITEILP